MGGKFLYRFAVSLQSYVNYAINVDEITRQIKKNALHLWKAVHIFIRAASTVPSPGETYTHTQ